MPYPLPDKPYDEGDFDYFLVALPRGIDFHRAAFGHFSDLGSARFWGMEGYTKPDSDDAAQRMLQAIAETLRIYDMGWLDDVYNAIDEIEPLLEALQFHANCCGESDISDGTLYTDSVTDGVGDVPQNIIDAGYATGVSDWAGYEAYKCMIAHVLVDDLYGKFMTLAPYVDSAGKIIGGVATIVGIITTLFSAGLTALAGGILAVTGAAASIYSLVTSASQVTAIANAIEAAREDLVCAAMNSDGSEDFITKFRAEIDAQFSAIEAELIKLMNFGPTARALLSGEYSTMDIAGMLQSHGYDPADYTCDCEYLPDGWRYETLPITSANVVSNGTIVGFTDNQVTITITGNSPYPVFSFFFDPVNVDAGHTMRGLEVEFVDYPGNWITMAVNQTGSGVSAYINNWFTVFNQQPVTQPFKVLHTSNAPNAQPIVPTTELTYDQLAGRLWQVASAPYRRWTGATMQLMFDSGAWYGQSIRIRFRALVYEGNA